MEHVPLGLVLFTRVSCSSAFSSSDTQVHVLFFFFIINVEKIKTKFTHIYAVPVQTSRGHRPSG